MPMNSQMSQSFVQYQVSNLPQQLHPHRHPDNVSSEEDDTGQPGAELHLIRDAELGLYLIWQGIYLQMCI